MRLVLPDVVAHGLGEYRIHLVHERPHALQFRCVGFGLGVVILIVMRRPVVIFIWSLYISFQNSLYKQNYQYIFFNMSDKVYTFSRAVCAENGQSHEEQQEHNNLLCCVPLL